jgi:hypothetical protein
MPLVGGGGAGNIAGSNPSGTSGGLQYIGDHVYGNSGAITATNGSDGTLFEFTTGVSYAIVNFGFGLGPSNISASKIYGYKISINSEVVLENVSTSDGDGTLVFDGAAVQQRILLPSYSTIKIEATTTDTDDMTCYGILTGRVY